MAKPGIGKRNRITRVIRTAIRKEFDKGKNTNQTLLIVQKKWPSIHRHQVAYQFSIWKDNKDKEPNGPQLKDFITPNWESGQPERAKMEELAQAMSPKQSLIMELKTVYHERAELHAEMSAMYYRAGESLTMAENIENWNDSTPDSGGTTKVIQDRLNHLRHTQTIT